MSTSQAGGFNAEVWRAQRGSSARNNPRSGMVVDLERSHLKPGMSRAEVQKLLGEPDERQERSDVYDLGAAPFGVDYESFVIDYDGADKLARTRVTRS